MNLPENRVPRTQASGAVVSERDAFAVSAIRRHDRNDGSIVLENIIALPSPLPDVMERLDLWAEKSGDSILISEPADEGRRSLTYRDAARLSVAFADILTGSGYKAGDAICVVAGAGCDHAIVKLACLRAGLVHAPLSPTLVDTKSGRLKLSEMLRICRPVAIFAEQEILSRLRKLDIPVDVDLQSLSRWAKDASRADKQAEAAESRRRHPRSPDDAAAIYFTSGSTGSPKGVVITRRMIGAVQAAIACHWPFFSHHRPVIVDWLPWHHVFGGLDNFFKMVWNGGAYHIRGAPARETIDETARYIAKVRPTLYVDVPFGIKLLLDRLENDPDLRAAFFSRLELIFFAGAGMDAETWSRLNRIIPRPADPDRPCLRLASGYGSTEAGSTICLAHEEPGSPGEIGVPLPGHALRLADVEGRTEIRVRGPNVSPGYIDAEGSVPMPLDELGFLRTGDVAAPVRPFHPELGLRFDGRVAEDFKLTNGTRVRVGALRQMLLSVCAPYLADVAIAGETRDYLGALLFPSPAAAELDAEARARIFARALSDHNAQWPNSSMAVRRAMVMDVPPDAESGEVNDKGHLVQRQCLQNRKGDVERLFDRRPGDRIIVPTTPQE